MNKVEPPSSSTAPPTSTSTASTTIGTSLGIPISALLAGTGGTPKSTPPSGLTGLSYGLGMGSLMGSLHAPIEDDSYEDDGGSFSLAAAMAKASPPAGAVAPTLAGSQATQKKGSDTPSVLGMGLSLDVGNQGQDEGGSELSFLLQAVEASYRTRDRDPLMSSNPNPNPSRFSMAAASVRPRAEIQARKAQSEW